MYIDDKDRGCRLDTMRGDEPKSSDTYDKNAQPRCVFHPIAGHPPADPRHLNLDNSLKLQTYLIWSKLIIPDGFAGEEDAEVTI